MESLLSAPFGVGSQPNHTPTHTPTEADTGLMAVLDGLTPADYRGPFDRERAAIAW